MSSVINISSDIAFTMYVCGLNISSGCSVQILQKDYVDYVQFGVVRGMFIACINTKVEHGLIFCANEHCKATLGSVFELGGVRMVNLINVRKRIFSPVNILRDSATNHFAIYTSISDVPSYQGDSDDETASNYSRASTRSFSSRSTDSGRQSPWFYPYSPGYCNLRTPSLDNIEDDMDRRSTTTESALAELDQAIQSFESIATEDLFDLGMSYLGSAGESLENLSFSDFL